MQEGIFDYLDDGQISATVSHWRRSLCEDGDGVLSVCRQLLQSREEAALDAEILTRCATIEQVLCDLLPSIRQAQSDLPVSRSIFSGGGDHAAAYGVVCRFLVLFERTGRTLAQADASLEALLPSFREQTRRDLQTEASLLTIRSAAQAERAEAVLSHSIEALDLLEERRGMDQALLSDLSALRQILGGWFGFAKAFLPRLYAAADLEHDGAAASPARLAQLFGELFHTAEQTLLQLRKQIDALRLRRE